MRDLCEACPSRTVPILPGGRAPDVSTLAVNPTISSFAATIVAVERAGAEGAVIGYRDSARIGVLVTAAPS